MGDDFALAANTESSINYLPVGVAALNANTLFTTSPAVGSITVV